MNMVGSEMEEETSPIFFRRAFRGILSESVSELLSDRVSEILSETVSEILSESVSEILSESVSGILSERVSEIPSERWSQGVSKGVSEEPPIELHANLKEPPWHFWRSHRAPCEFGGDPIAFLAGA